MSDMAKPRYRLHADGNVSPVFDGLMNVVANLGTGRDKASGATVFARAMNPAMLAETYRGSWSAKKGVEIPALDACRKWRDWQAEAEEISAIEEEERRLGVQRLVLQALVAARLFGGCALLIGADTANPALPLNPAAVKRGGLRYLTLVHKRMLSPGMLEANPEDANFGQPAWWTLNTGAASMVRIHPSRLVLFRGAVVPDDMMMGSDHGWGDSVLVAAMDAVLQHDSAKANVSSLIYEAKVDTIGVPNFMASLGEPAYEATLIRRFSLAETAKGINGTLVHDAEEVLGQKQASFASLPELIDRFSQSLCAAFDIPATRFMGQSPAGLSATGESDIRNYYDRISAAQEIEMRPAMAVLDECLIMSALGRRPPETHYRWASLWQISDKERADIGKVQADTLAVLRGTQLVPEEPLAQAAVNMLTESGVMPGLEGAMAEWAAANPEVDDPGEDGRMPVKAPAASEGATAATDAAPLPLYVRRDVKNGAEILKWARDQGFKSTLEATDLHVTIAFSRTPVDWMTVGDPWEGDLEIVAGGARLLEKFGEARVLLFSSSRLSWRHEEIRNAGASWDHPEYQPHITISYDAGSPDLADVQPYRGRIVLGPEIFETVKDDWQSGIKEAKA